MAELAQTLGVVMPGEQDKLAFVAQVVGDVQAADYEIIEVDDQKPWGAYIRIDGAQAERFITEFFPGLTMDEARLGMENAELSPKLLIVAPGARLSWQYHERRAERWNFLTPGGYYKSDSDQQGELHHAKAGEVVQIARSERHRLVGDAQRYTMVAEIWQHIDPNEPSREEDIIRLADDYQR